MTDERFASIGGLLKSPPRKRTPLRIADEPDAAAPETPTEPEAVPLPAPPRAKSRPGTAATPKSTSSAGGTQRVVLRLRQPLHTQLVHHVASVGSSQGNVVLDAIESAHTTGHLADLVTQAQNTEQDSLFARTKKRGPAEATIPIELRLRREAVNQIDRLATETGADSRTQLIVVALQNYLHHPDS